MRILATVLGAALALGALLAGGTPAARAGEEAPRSPSAAVVSPDGSPPPQPGTGAEEREYELREAASPEVQEFVGGDGGGFLFGVLVLAALVLLVVVLAKEVAKD
jgi:hypothetical protein